MADPGLHIACHHRRHRALVFADDGPDLRRGGHEQIRRVCLDDLHHAQLMRGVAIAVQERYDDTFTTRRTHAGNGGLYGIFIQRHVLATIEQHAALESKEIKK